MKIDVRDLDYLSDDEEQFGGARIKSKKKQPKLKMHDEFKKRDNRKFNKHPKKEKKGFDEE